jgi:hypothetical protein
LKSLIFSYPHRTYSGWKNVNWTLGFLVGSPDWAIFRPLGYCLHTLGCSLKIAKLAHIFGNFYQLCINFVKNGQGYILGDFFPISSGHPAFLAFWLLDSRLADLL